VLVWAVPLMGRNNKATAASATLVGFMASPDGYFTTQMRTRILCA
jgi:hypothetical protein